MRRSHDMPRTGWLFQFYLMLNYPDLKDVFMKKLLVVLTLNL